MSGHIRTDIDGRVCTITLEKEGSRNAMDYDMAESLTETLQDLEARDEAIVVVLTGHGQQAFSAGFDLDIDRSDRTEEQKQIWTGMNDAIENYTHPTIAMINGHTYGGAVEMAASCDIRIGVESATFGITPARIGLVYTGKAINRVMNLIGPAKTKEMLFTADGIPADHAYEIGLLNYVVADHDELEDRTYEMAENIATNAPLSLEYMKEIVHTIQEKGRLSEAENRWVKRLRDQMFESEDHAEGVEAFQEGREPEFEGR
jgi:methylmalonyl-CoA decarboxylase